MKYVYAIAHFRSLVPTNKNEPAPIWTIPCLLAFSGWSAFDSARGTMTNIEITKKRTMSPSQAAIYNNCNYKWKLQYKDNWKQKGYVDKAPHVGIIIHELLATYYDNLKISDFEHSYIVAKNAVLENIRKISVAIIAEDPDLLIRVKIAAAVVERYIREYSPYEDKKWDVLKTEYFFEVPIRTPKGNDVLIQGYIDALVSINGKIWVVDHKSHESNFWDEMQIKLDLQFSIYAACMSLLGYQIQGVIVNQLNTYQYVKPLEQSTEKLYRRVRTLRSSTEQTNALRELSYIVDAIITNEEDGTPFRKSLTKNCKFCSFNTHCLYSLKGLDADSFLSQTHEQKGSKLENELSNLTLKIEYED